MESEVLKTGMNLIMEKQIIPNPICPNGCIYRLIHNKRIKNENTNYVFTTDYYSIFYR